MLVHILYVNIIIPRGGLVFGRCVGHHWRRVRLAALGWSDRLTHVGITIFAETIVARCRTKMLLLAFVLPDTQPAQRSSNTLTQYTRSFLVLHSFAIVCSTK